MSLTLVAFVKRASTISVLTLRLLVFEEDDLLEASPSSIGKNVGVRTIARLAMSILFSLDLEATLAKNRQR